MARRKDREANKKGMGGQTVINVAIAAGNVTPQMIQERRNRLAMDEAKELDFLKKTVVEGTLIESKTIEKDE
jgi:hypothetical protein